jgi:DNA-nicking Smr family endonuclease
VTRRAHSGSGGDDDERRLFEEAMQDVRRLPEMEAPIVVDGVAITRTTSLPPPAGLDSPTFDVEIAGEQVSVFHPSLPPGARKALRRGTTRPERMLDLHGARIAVVSPLVERMVADALRAGERCLHLIPGRGLRSGDRGPVLRNAVVQLLTHPPLSQHVLGVVSAPPSLGGTGALLVLLRKTR